MKRKRSTPFPSWGAKKPRSARRATRVVKKRTGGRARTSSWTMQTGVGKGLRPMSRKLKPRQMRKMLWRDTLFKAHWKSAEMSPLSFTSDTSQGKGILKVVLPTFVGTVGPTTAFWTVTGGLQLKDTGSTAPIFNDSNLVIRGGQVGINFTCPDAQTVETVVRIWKIWLIKIPNINLIEGQTINYGSQLTSGPDFEAQVGRVLDYKEATLNNAYPSFTYVTRMGVQKIDMETFGTEFGSQIAFVVAVVNMQDNTAITLPSIVWHDMSFTGDVSGHV